MTNAELEALNRAKRLPRPLSDVAFSLPWRFIMRQYLNSYGDYEWVDAESPSLTGMATAVEHRLKETPVDVAFVIKVEGKKVQGCTLKDPLGRKAIEWEVVGDFAENDAESFCNSQTPARVWQSKPTRRPVANVATPRPWWQFWK